MKAYGNLNDLLSENSKAKKLYLSQPEHVQGSLVQHSGNIHSYEELQSCINSIWRDE